MPILASLETLPQRVPLAVRARGPRTGSRRAAAAAADRQPQDALQARLAEQLVIAPGVGLPHLGPAVQVRQLHVEHGGLEGIQPAVHSDQGVVIAGPHAVSAEELELVGQIGAVGGQHAAVAGPAEVLVG